jgi:chloride channel protein, CIC family
MRHTIMTEKIARRGVRVPSEYAADYLDQVWVADVATKVVTALSGADTVEQVKAWLASRAPETRHHAFPVLAEDGALLGVLTRHDILEHNHGEQCPIRKLLKRPPAVAFDNSSLREAADLMVKEGVGRLPIVGHAEPSKVIGILTRSDLLSAHARRIDENVQRHARMKMPFVRIGRLSKRTR